MGQDQALKLAEEEKKELSIGLLRSWWLEAAQALVDVVGSDDALSFLKPYSQHAGKAARRVYQSIINRTLDGYEASQAGGYLFFWLGGRFTPLYREDDGSGIGELYDCATSGICKEACIVCCSIMPLTWLKELNPDWEIRLTRSLSWGDGYCQWTVWRRGTSARVEAVEEMRIPEDKTFRDPLDEPTRNYLGLAYAGEYWVMATRAILDSPGRCEGIEDLNHRMRLSGLSVGIRARERMRKENRTITIYNIIQLISELHHRKGEITAEDERVECIVEECPFAGSAPPEICLQYEAFFNGICEAIDPDYTFAYDRMMTKGDPTCHWVVRKKQDSEIDKIKEQASYDDPARALALRFAKGEISHEEFDRDMELLRKHKMVKQ